MPKIIKNQNQEKFPLDSLDTPAEASACNGKFLSGVDSVITSSGVGVNVGIGVGCGSVFSA